MRACVEPHHVETVELPRHNRQCGLPRWGDGVGGARTLAHAALLRCCQAVDGGKLDLGVDQAFRQLVGWAGPQRELKRFRKSWTPAPRLALETLRVVDAHNAGVRSTWAGECRLQ